MSTPKNFVTPEVQAVASSWLSRRDRGLTAREQDAYLDWLYRDPAHGQAIVQLERAWNSLDRLEQWRPAHSARPNPDLLAPRWRPRCAWLASALATAAVLTVAFYLWLPSRFGPAAAPRAAIIHPGPERMDLEDGSVVELNTGARVEAHFTATTRGVRLVRGEAHFAVAKDADRPFVVMAGPVAVRAVGTAFTLALGSGELSVLVTEGKVQVDDHETPRPPAGSSAESPGTATTRARMSLTAGQRVVLDLTRRAAPVVQEYTPVQIERALAWQGIRMELEDLPLGDVVTEFNRYNRTRLSVANPETAAILVGGSFRADNVDAFVRLAERSFGVKAFRQGNEIILRKVE